MALDAQRWWVMIALSAWAMLAPIARAQQAGSVDQSFGASLGLAGGVSAILLQPDGKVLVVGGNKGIGRLNADGSPDASFDPGTGTNENGVITALGLQADGKIIVGGDFTAINGVAANGVARLDADGSVDAGFAVGAGPNGYVETVAVQSDGKIVVGGYFTVFNGQARYSIARLNADGSLDAGFVPDTGGDRQDSIRSLAVQTDGKILVGGEITSRTNGASNNIARLNADGSLDKSFDPGTISAGRGYIESVTLEPDRKILAIFTPFSGDARTGIARLHADGSLDTSFHVGRAVGGDDTGASGTIQTVAVQPDGKILVAGVFTTFSGVARNGIARLDTDGSLDTTFDAAAGTDVSGSIETVAVRADGEILAGGDFTSFNGVALNGVVLLSDDGVVDDSFKADDASGPNLPVEAEVLQADGKIIIGGEFTTFNGESRNGIARLNADGSLDTNFDPGTGATGDANFNASIDALVVQADGKILVGGSFTAFNGESRNSLARINADGSLDTGFDPGMELGASGTVRALVVQDDAKVLVGGYFLGSDDTLLANIARLNADGSLDTSFTAGAGVGSGLVATVSAVVVQADGKVLVGGNFSLFDGETRNGIARLNADGSLDIGFVPDTGAEGNPITQALAVQADGKILAGNLFISNNAVSNAILRLNPDGSMDNSFIPGTGTGGATATIDAVAVQGDGKILVSGGFTAFDGGDYGGVARLNADGSLDTGFDPGTEVDGEVYSLSLQPDGKVIFGGSFVQVDNVTRNYVARLNGDGSLDAGFVPGQGVANIAALVLQPDDERVLIGGSFFDVGDTPINALARLNNTDGSLDTTFAPGFSTGDTVQAIALQSDAGQPDDGDVLVAALESDDTSAAAALDGLPGDSVHRPNARTTVQNHLYRCRKVDGHRDPDFNAMTDGITLAVAGLSGRLTLIGGGFGLVNGLAHANLARLNPDGSLDASFVGVADSTVRASSVTTAGRIIVGGDFASVDGTARSHVARLNPDGSLDVSFDPGMGPNGTVNAVRATANGQVLVAGVFTSVDGVARGGVARLNPDGSLDAGFVPGPVTATIRTVAQPRARGARRTTTATTVTDDDASAGAIMSLDVQADGKVVIGGLFDQLGDATRHDVARLNADGSVDTTFDSGSGPDAAVNALQLQPDGRTLLGGSFASVEGLARRGAARLLGDPSTVGISAKTSKATLAFGRRVTFVVTRTGGNQVGALTVGYKTAGPARTGVDYKPLNGSVTIPPGSASANIKLKLLEGDPNAPLQTSVTLKLKVGSDYMRDASNAKAKVMLVRPP